MPLYACLFRFDLVHDYFADPANLKLSFRPDAHSADWIERTGCVMRAADNRLTVLFDSEARGGSAAVREPTHLVFDVVAEDPLFIEFTSEWPPAVHGAPSFSGEAATAGADGVWRLGKPVASPSIARQGAHLRLSLPVGGDAKAVGRRYRLDLTSRSTAWKYILLDDWGDVTPMVVDPAGKIAFSAAAPEPIADGRSALAIVSSDAIALSERPSQRFQLRAANDGGAGALLIATLPAAAPGHLGMDAAAAKPRMVSEIYVAR
jgi:hypothetical protein